VCAGRSHGAIGEELDAADAESAGAIDGDAGGARAQHLVEVGSLSVEEGVDEEFQLVVARHLLEHRDAIRGAEGQCAEGHAVGCEAAQGVATDPAVFVERGFRDVPEKLFHGGVDESARELASGSALGVPRFRGSIARREVRAAERLGVDPDGVSVDPSQADRCVGEEAIEGLTAQVGIGKEPVLVPVRAEDPARWAWPGSLEEIEDRGYVETSEVGSAASKPEPPEVDVCFAKGGKQARPVGADLLILRGRHVIGTSADADDPPVADQQRVRGASGGVEVDTGVAKQHEAK
jgi:hypothetical protein